jgi:hypothetical protein
LRVLGCFSDQRSSVYPLSNAHIFFDCGAL